MQINIIYQIYVNITLISKKTNSNQNYCIVKFIQKQLNFKCLNLCQPIGQVLQSQAKQQKQQNFIFIEAYKKKFLKPYFVQIDEQQIDVGFWNGELILKNLILKKEIFLLYGINIEVVDSIIQEIKIQIPWKAIKKQPIKIEINGFKMIVSNKLDQTQEEKEEMKSKLLQIKLDTLQQFENSLDKYFEQRLEHIKKKQKDKKKTQENGKTKKKDSFYQNALQGILSNLQFKINNIEIINIYHINNFEVVKVGLNIDQLYLGSVDQLFKQNNIDSIFKEIQIRNFCVFFEFYDSFLDTYIQVIYFYFFLIKFYQKNDNYFNIKDKKNGYFSQKFYKKDEEIEQILQEKTDNYILKNFNVDIKLKIDIQNNYKADVNVTIDDAVIFLKQNQVRLLIKSLKELATYNSKRPKIRPKEKSQDQSEPNGTEQWWRYIIDKIITLKQLPNSVKQKGLMGFLRAVKYRRFYTKKRMNSKLKENETYFLDKFEIDFPLSQLIILRQMSINSLVDNKLKLMSSHYDERVDAEKWFYSIDKDFQKSKILNLNVYYLNDVNFDKANIGNSQNTENTLESEKRENKDQQNEQNSFFTYNVEVQMKSFQILIEENQMLQDIKNLHYQATLIKDTLYNKPRLQQQILSHIKKNFINELSKKGIKQFQQNDKDQENKQENSKIIDASIWNFETFKNYKKLLLHLKMNSLLLIFNQDSLYTNQLQIDVGQINITDMHSLNKCYNQIMEIKEGIQIIFKTEVIKINKSALSVKAIQKITHNSLDVNIPTLIFTLTKPFIERCSKYIQIYFYFLFLQKKDVLSQLLFFDPEKVLTKRKKDENNIQIDYDCYKQEQFFNQFLMQKDIETTFLNLSVQIGKINVYLPINYQIASDILTFQIKNLKIFKREHDTELHQENLNQSFKQKDEQEEKLQEPLLINIYCMKILIVQDYDWEEKKNIFLHNYKKIEKNQLNRDDFQKKIVQIENVETILETLPIQIKIETKYTKSQIGVIHKLESNKKINLIKHITPQCYQYTISLPFLIVNMSIKQMQLIMYLIQMWAIKGYTFQSFVNEQDDQQQNKGNGTSTSNVYENNYIIDPNIIYTPQIIEMLKVHNFSIVEVNLDGVQVNFRVCSKEKQRNMKILFIIKIIF
ncbi:hypothetical protein IMG5_064500 [Ichthyophthirius multifiliis]|uniref:Autophagy-related protein 2 n=1 Tax=Ichthyophthirius multifiliis TaxID=5932 RepID=G0QP65_ICHMU|nr:hypothetical protein IMG5_064500 [Ichthyophthirius multifiliis]EGR32995.1 hypothetical protein IMG5_064500 [Ichthyophthirius multifiliis]|eukprot:XP_004036981.1 hypothetical protein IMG5_064500 [Ichthyophthirius multifiliis]